MPLPSIEVTPPAVVRKAVTAAAKKPTVTAISTEAHKAVSVAKPALRKAEAVKKPAQLRRALDLPVHGVVGVQAAPSDLIRGIRQLAQGERVIDADLVVAMVAPGTLTGALTDSSGDAVGTVDQPGNMPAAVAQATCRILDLTLGPLHLDVLGQVVDLRCPTAASRGAPQLTGHRDACPLCILRFRGAP
ncbi:hypothetical protein ACQP2E_12985 [Actinoplanes sp. CA-015351]|uniref:hypothetical protein n=1 Tax=Actinoplanes sp. CA-015351 TaxID=3239897 RepID=UPI003D96E56C